MASKNPSRSFQNYCSSCNRYKEVVERLLEGTGIKINGNNPWDIQIYYDEFYERVLTHGTLGLGESYIDGWWKCVSIDQLVERLLKANIKEKVDKDGSSFKFSLFFDYLKSKLTNPQNIKRAFNIGEKHYDLGNDLFYYMLDNRMIYSCGYWKDADNLDKAQESKLELICKKINLERGMRILDIGCGFGGFLKYASEKYLISGVGVTISKEQKKLADERCKNLPIEIKLEDYRELNEKFDRIISIGMFEHVGYKNYRTYMEKVNSLLKENGLFLLHTIGKDKIGGGDKFINKYIFPNSYIPTSNEITKSFEKLFVMEDWHNFGADYDKTLIAWNKNFQNNWCRFKDKYSDRFKRMWEYYLLSCAGTFRARKQQLWQIVLSKEGIVGGYNQIR